MIFLHNIKRQTVLNDVIHYLVDAEVINCFLLIRLMIIMITIMVITRSLFLFLKCAGLRDRQGRHTYINATMTFYCPLNGQVKPLDPIHYLLPSPVVCVIKQNFLSEVLENFQILSCYWCVLLPLILWIGVEVRRVTLMRYLRNYGWLSQEGEKLINEASDTAKYTVLFKRLGSLLFFF